MARKYGGLCRLGNRRVLAQETGECKAPVSERWDKALSGIAGAPLKYNKPRSIIIENEPRTSRKAIKHGQAPRSPIDPQIMLKRPRPYMCVVRE